MCRQTHSSIDTEDTIHSSLFCKSRSNIKKQRGIVEAELAKNMEKEN